jgi:hypothetical protein
MRNQKLAILFFLLKTFTIVSQTSIPSELMNKPQTENLYRIRDNVESVIAYETNYLKNETYVNKWIFSYTSDTIVRGKLLKNDELKSVFEYILNDKKEIIETKVNFFNKSVINDKHHIKYQLSNNTKILNFLDDDSKIASKMIVEMDSLKSPIKITSFNFNNEVQSMETAEYNYKTNIYNYKVYNYYNELVLDKNENYSYNFILEKNEYNDITKMIWPLSKNKSLIIFEYKYDPKGNWIKRTKKHIDNEKESISTIIKRQIKYKD